MQTQALMTINFQQPPKPLKRPPDLRKLMALCGVYNFNGAIDTYYQCPCCLGIERMMGPPTLEQHQIRRDTLRVFPTPENDWGFQCSNRNCGFQGNGVLLLRQSSQGRLGTWDSVIEAIQRSDLFQGDEPDPEWIERARAWADLQWTFEKAVANVNTPEMGEPKNFGEYGVIQTEELIRRFPPVGALSQTRETKVRLRLIRTIQGLPSHLRVSRYDTDIEICRCYFHAPGALHLITPRWARYYDWSQELAIATDFEAASTFQDELRNENLPTVPLAYVHHCTGELIEEVPTRLIQYLVGPKESGEFALAFAHLRAEVRVRQIGEHLPDTPRKFYQLVGDEQDPIEFVADEVLRKTESDVESLAFLEAVLAKPWITAQTCDSLSRAVTARLKIPSETVPRLSGPFPRLHPFEGEHATFLCRNRIYLRSTDRSRKAFRPCSNFSLRTLESYLADDQSLNHRLSLHLGENRAEFTLKEEEFLEGKKLMEAATAAGINAGFPTLPTVNFAEGISLLSQIVRGTQPQPLATLHAPAHWGFHLAEFQGPDYSIRPEGLRRHALRTNFPRAVSMLPSIGSSAGIRDEWEYLRCEARRFASWFQMAPGLLNHFVCDLFFTGLYWLHRGASGLQSFLALRTPEQFDALERLLGIQSIEVGRAPREHAGVPRLMRSSYWSTEQYRRQGRVAVALEDQAHRTDPLIIQSSYAPIGGTNPKFPDLEDMPESILPLLSYAVIGQPTLKACFERLWGLVEEEELKNQYRMIFYHGGSSLIPPGRYLDRFFSALKSTSFIEKYSIHDHQQEGMILLMRSVFDGLPKMGHVFHERSVIQELRDRSNGSDPVTRYGKKRVPVLRIPSEMLQSTLV
ncbi:MAG: hypothetical protein AAF491_00675, partial [Verrucomicrobiota bacterium]